MIKNISYNKVFADLTKPEKEQCIDVALNLIEQVYNGLGMSKLIYLFLDNDVLITIEKRSSKNYIIKFIALLILFSYMSKHKTKYKFKIVLTPINMLEYFHNENVFMKRDKYLDARFQLILLSRALGIPVITMGLQNFKQARTNYKRMMHDYRLLHKHLTKISIQRWDIKLDNGKRYVIPAFAADALTPKIKTKFFGSYQIRQIIQMIINKEIVENNESKRIRKMRHPILNSFAGLLKIRKDNTLEGFGDAFLISQCDITSHFMHGNYKDYVPVGISFENNLKKALHFNAAKMTNTNFISRKDIEEDFEKRFNQDSEKFFSTLNNKDSDDFIYGYLDWMNDFLNKKVELDMSENVL